MATRSRRLLIGAWMALLLLFAGTAIADGRRIKVGVLADWPPEYSTTHDGVATGFAVDAMNEVAKRASLEVELKTYSSFAAAGAALRSGEIDVIPTFGISAGRREFCDFTQPLETFAISVFVRDGSHVPSTLAELRGKDVAVVEANLAAGLLSQRSDLRLREYPDVRAALYDLLAGHVDALAFPRPVLERIAEDAGLNGRIRVAPIELMEVKRAIAVRSGQPELLARLDLAVGEFVRSDDYRRLYQRWYATPAAFWTTSRVLYGSALLFASMLAGFVWFRSRARGALSREAQQGQRREETARRETETRYQTLLERASDSVFVTDRDLRIVEVNRSACDLVGFEREELVGKQVSELLTVESLEADALMTDRLLAGETLLVERELRRKHGSVSVEVSARQVSSQHIVAIVRDISARRMAEKYRREQEATLRQSQKMEAVGRLAAGVAHDFNNLLTAITGYADLLSIRLADRSDVLRDLSEIREAAERGGALTRQLLVFSRHQKSTLEVVSPAAVVSGLRPMLARLIGEDIELTVHGEAAGYVKSDRRQLEQVIMNLVVNARDALPDGGHIAIRVSDQVVEAPLRTRMGTVDPGRYVVLEVEDDGVGIESGVQSRIFEPFFTTKAEHQGTGLGLATVLGIAQQSSGQVDVESSAGHGATFRIFLPATDEAVRREPEERSTRPASTPRDATVLVVEDEDDVRHVIVKNLGRSMNVHQAATAAEALKVARGLPHLNVLVTDVVMPGMKGTELAAELGRAFPDLRVLFVSGYTHRGLHDLLSEPGRRAFLQKPFAMSVLTTAVSELMDAQARDRAQPSAAGGAARATAALVDSDH